MSDYEIYAIRYATKAERRSSENFVGGDPHDRPMPMDFFVWALVGDEGTILVDTGFDEKAGAGRGYQLQRPVAEGLRLIGIDPADVKDTIITHMHWDHAGNHTLLPNTRYHVQEREMRFCTGRCMCDAGLRRAYSAQDVTHMVQRVFEDRVSFHAEDSQFNDGISLHFLGGHTEGLQAVRVMTKRGPVVLASDASHYYANILENRPFPVLADEGGVLRGFEIIKKLAQTPAHIIPGHDPQVLSLFPPAKPGLTDIVRLDLAPSGTPA